MQGAKVVRPYTERFKVTFPVAVDEGDVFGRAFGLKAIPVSFLVDEVGIIRLRGGGPNAKFLAQVEALLQEPLCPVRGIAPQLPGARPRPELELALQQHPADDKTRLALAEAYAAEGRYPEARRQLEAVSPTARAEAAVLLVWGRVLLGQGEREAALTKLKAARDLEPDNWRIRKQIWAIEHPDKFYEAESPDYAWQKEELKRERSRQ